jgi:hypothetical protein
MQDLLRKYHEPRKKSFTLKNAEQLFISEADINIAPIDVTYAWGMSQMTNVLETKNFVQYDDLRLVEFYEFFARLADRRFPGEERSVDVKVEMFMDLIFPKILNKKRIPVNIEVEEDSESDDDY